MKLSVSVFLIIGLIFMIGCKKPSSSPPPSPNSVSQVQASAVIEQTNCPVMGGPIDKNVFVEYQGKKVYFCCKQCVAEFQKNPEKYLDKLPQFKK